MPLINPIAPQPSRLVQNIINHRIFISWLLLCRGIPQKISIYNVPQKNCQENATEDIILSIYRGTCYNGNFWCTWSFNIFIDNVSASNKIFLYVCKCVIIKYYKMALKYYLYLYSCYFPSTNIFKYSFVDLWTTKYIRIFVRKLSKFEYILIFAQNLILIFNYVFFMKKVNLDIIYA